jgi:hypothetical protein
MLGIPEGQKQNRRRIVEPGGGLGEAGGKSLLNDPVHAITSFVLRGLDLDGAPLGGG